MAKRWTQSILSFLVVLSAYWLYALIVVPWIDPDQNQREHAPLPSLVELEKPTDRFRPLIERLFPADSWELNQAMVLKNDQFMLLVNGYETLNGGLQLKLKSCTVVLNPGGALDRAAGEQRSCMILTATEGAILDFDRPFGITNGGLGKLLGGRFVGDVSIRSHSLDDASGQPTANFIEIETRNVQINSQRIWTSHEVRFRYGQNHGAGRDLMINLTEDETVDFRRLPAENPTHLRSLELVHLDRLTVTTTTGSSLTDDSPTNPTTLRIRCQGPLMFDFVGGGVTLKDNVTIQRIHGVDGLDARQPTIYNRGSSDGQSDWLTCDLLAMQFQALSSDDPSNPDQDASSNRPRPKWELPDFALAQITAFGNPAVINAPSYQVLAQAERIELQLSHNRLLLQDTEQAVLRYAAHTFRAPRMEYFVDPQGGPGRAEVSGSGQYVGALAEDVVQLRWQDGLKFGPSDGQYLLEVDGNAVVHWGRFPITAAVRKLSTNAPPNLPSGTAAAANPPLPYRLSAGQLQVWLRQEQPPERSALRLVAHEDDELGFRLTPPQSSHEQPESTEAIPTNEPMPAALPSSPQSPTSRVEGLASGWRPDRVIARTHVQLRTPQLAGDVEYAKVEFRAGPNSTVANGDDSSLTEPGFTGPALSGPLGPQPPSAASVEQYQLTGHELSVALRSGRDGETPRFASVIIQGDVQLRQVASSPDAAAVEIQGSIVELIQSPADSGVIGRVSGTPASISARGMELTGRDIRVDQSRNCVWVDDAGAAYISLPKQIAIRFSRRTATLQVAWQGGMNFDGTTVTCEQGVEIRGPAQIATADALRATLAQPIRWDARDARQPSNGFGFRPPRNSDQVLSEISLTGNVWLENRSFDERGQASIDEFRLRSLTYNQSTGQLVGDGPGWISSVRYAQPRAAALMRTAATNATPVREAQLTHSIIEFQKQLNGSLAQREVSVHDRVRAIHGPIDDWQQRIHFDDSERSPETVVMRAMRLTVAEMSADGGQPALEFAASGNTEIEGRTFLARAQHIRYAQAKDRLVMEGDGRSVVQLSYQSRVGAPRNNAFARKIQYWIHENRMNGEGFVFGDVTGPIANQPGGPLPTQQDVTGEQNILPRQRPTF